VYNTDKLPVEALRSVNLSIAEGELVALMGPSGSGKSTLLTVLGAMNPPTEGTVTIDGIEPYDLPVERQADFRHEYVGFVFQQYHLLPYLSVLENVLLPSAISRESRQEKRRLARAALEDVGLGEKADRLPSQLSGGEQARVAIARALVNQPPLLLLDEPTGNLDSATGNRVLESLKELNRGGQTVVMVTHDQETARYAGRIVRLRDGRVENGASLERPQGFSEDTDFSWQCAYEKTGAQSLVDAAKP
jgi:putative ABC transport system ATP-binding protein